MSKGRSAELSQSRVRVALHAVVARADLYASAVGTTMLQIEETPSRPTEHDGKLWNSMPVYGPEGLLLANYRKVHLSRVLKSARRDLAIDQDGVVADQDADGIEALLLDEIEQPIHAPLLQPAKGPRRPLGAPPT